VHKGQTLNAFTQICIRPIGIDLMNARSVHIERTGHIPKFM